MMRDTSGSVREDSRDRIRTATEATFSSLVLDGEGPIVVEFMSYGCAYCRALEPVLQQVAATLASTHTIYRVNTALAADLMSAYRVTGTPTLIMFRDGVEVGRAAGPRPSLASLVTVLRDAFE